MDNSIEAKNIAIGTMRTIIEPIINGLINSRIVSCIWTGILSIKNNEDEIPKTETRPETKPVKDTTNNLPIVISNFVAGEERSVSKDPLSFSPAPRSIAGYIAPRKINMTRT